MQTYNMLYQISYWYFIIAGVNWLIAWLVISLGWQHYLEQVNSIPVNNKLLNSLWQCLCLLFMDLDGFSLCRE